MRPSPVRSPVFGVGSAINFCSYVTPCILYFLESFPNHSTMSFPLALRSIEPLVFSIQLGFWCDSLYVHRSPSICCECPHAFALMIHHGFLLRAPPLHLVLPKRPLVPFVSPMRSLCIPLPVYFTRMYSCCILFWPAIHKNMIVWLDLTTRCLENETISWGSIIN